MNAKELKKLEESFDKVKGLDDEIASKSELIVTYSEQIKGQEKEIELHKDELALLESQKTEVSEKIKEQRNTLIKERKDFDSKKKNANESIEARKRNVTTGEKNLDRKTRDLNSDKALFREKEEKLNKDKLRVKGKEVNLDSQKVSLQKEKDKTNEVRKDLVSKVKIYIDKIEDLNNSLVDTNKVKNKFENKINDIDKADKLLDSKRDENKIEDLRLIEQKKQIKVDIAKLEDKIKDMEKQEASFKIARDKVLKEQSKLDDKITKNNTIIYAIDKKELRLDDREAGINRRIRDAKRKYELKYKDTKV